MAKENIQVVVADSSRLIGAGLEAILAGEKDLNYRGQADSTERLMQILNVQAVDVILMDFTSSGFSLETIAEVLAKFPEVRVVAITPDQESTTIVNALKAGVTSYVKKNCDFDEIISSLRATAQGSKFFCGKILETIHDGNIDPDSEEYADFSCEPIHLSDREQEIITLIAEGMKNAEIAERLFLSTHTVNTHRKNIMQKLGVKNTAAIVMYAVKANLVNVNKFLFSSR